jgi:hypothetical protein
MGHPQAHEARSNVDDGVQRPSARGNRLNDATKWHTRLTEKFKNKSQHFRILGVVVDVLSELRVLSAVLRWLWVLSAYYGGYYRGPAFYLAIRPVQIAIGGGYW